MSSCTQRLRQLGLRRSGRDSIYFATYGDGRMVSALSQYCFAKARLFKQLEPGDVAIVQGIGKFTKISGISLIRYSLTCRQAWTFGISSSSIKEQSQRSKHLESFFQICMTAKNSSSESSTSNYEKCLSVSGAYIYSPWPPSKVKPLYCSVIHPAKSPLDT